MGSSTQRPLKTWHQWRSKGKQVYILNSKKHRKEEKVKKVDEILLFSNKPISENSLTQKIKQQIENGEFGDATDSWSDLEDVISTSSSSVVRTFLSANPWSKHGISNNL